jgi:hypothetical protein
MFRDGLFGADTKQITLLPEYFTNKQFLQIVTIANIFCYTTSCESLL